MILSPQTLLLAPGENMLTSESYILELTAYICSGLDASISFEADRPENLGLVFGGGGKTSFINATIFGVSES